MHLLSPCFEDLVPHPVPTYWCYHKIDIWCSIASSCPSRLFLIMRCDCTSGIWLSTPSLRRFTLFPILGCNCMMGVRFPTSPLHCSSLLLDMIQHWGFISLCHRFLLSDAISCPFPASLFELMVMIERKQETIVLINKYLFKKSHYTFFKTKNDDSMPFDGDDNASEFQHESFPRH